MNKTKNRITSKDLQTIKQLWEQGWSDKQIGEKLGRHHRTIQEVRKRHGLVRIEGLSAQKQEPESDRMAAFKRKFNTSARSKMVLNTLTAEELAVFEEEYFRVLEDIEDLTATEEQQLFLAIYELVLALRAQRCRCEEEKLVEETRQGFHTPADPSYRKFVDARFEKEYDQHMKSYQKFFEGLKLNREQRLKDEHAIKRSFLDYAEVYAKTSHQEVAAHEILEWSRKTDEELKRLITNNWLMGYAKG